MGNEKNARIKRDSAHGEEELIAALHARVGRAPALEIRFFYLSSSWYGLIDDSGG